MTTDDVREVHLASLAALVSHDVDRALAHRIRERCRHALDRRQRLATKAPKVGPAFWRAAEPVLVALICVVYLSEVVRRAMALYGF